MTSTTQEAITEPPDSAGKVTAADIREHLKVRFAWPDHVIFFEVDDGHGDRRADAVAVGMFKSRGQLVHGIEIKVSRGDWLQELKRGSKAEAVWRYCDRWWVAAPVGVVKKEELPEGWGLLLPRGSSMRAAVQASKLNPGPLDREFVASVLRRTGDRWDPKLYESAAYTKGIAYGKATAERNAKYEAESHRRLQKTVAEFEKKSGVNITHAWDAGQIGEIVALLLHRDPKYLQQRLEGELEAFREQAERISAALAKLKELRAVTPELKTQDERRAP